MGKFVLVVLVFAVVVYAAFWLLERRRANRPGARPSTPRPRPRAVGPDDDEDFLRDLNRRNRKRSRDSDQDKPKD